MQLHTKDAKSQRRQKATPGAVPRGRAEPGRRHTRAAASGRPGSRLHGLRWVPVPLAVLMAALGWLVLGGLVGQHAAAEDHPHGLAAGGLGLTVTTVLWMDSSMNVPGKGAGKGFQMPSSMMPGLQPPGDKRLRIQVYVRNISTDPQEYALRDFTLVAPGGKSWKIVANSTTQGAAQQAVLEPRFEATVDLYFDIPAGQSKHLSVRWSHGGTTVSFPVHPSGTDSTSVMAGM